jgi:YD repeat-containing protein
MFRPVIAGSRTVNDGRPVCLDKPAPASNHDAVPRFRPSISTRLLLVWICLCSPGGAAKGSYRVEAPTRTQSITCTVPGVAITLLLENGTDSPEWSTTWTDPAGRPLATLTSAGDRSDSFYNAKSQLTRTVDGDGTGQLYAYDAQGRRSTAVSDLNENGSIDETGPDRIVRTSRAILDDPAHGPVLRTITEAWATANSNTPTVLSVADQALNGRASWTTRSGLTATTLRSAPTGSGAWTTATTLPGVINRQNSRRFN